jgi:hypothetical protein
MISCLSGARSQTLAYAQSNKDKDTNKSLLTWVIGREEALARRISCAVTALNAEVVGISIG